MEEKRQMKISLKIAIILIVTIIVVIGILIFIFNRFFNEQKTEYTTKIGYCSGTLDCVEANFISSYSELEKYVSEFGTIIIDDDNALDYFNKKYFKKHTLAIVAHDVTYSKFYNCTTDNVTRDNFGTDANKNSTLTHNVTINNVTLNGTEANININLNRYENYAQTEQFTFITLDKNITNVNFNIETREYYDIFYEKPIIYLYPTEATEVSVKLLKDENLTCSYPKYKDAWKVLAQTNGNLKDLVTNRQLYSLYYESKNVVKFKVENDGFIVKDNDVATFLEEKLAILGLTEREAEEFIVYWLPKLEANKYNYIRFATLDEINENMPLEINPNPDTIIRVLMTFKGLENPINVQEQQLRTPNRKGFVAVEWGGTEIK